MKTITNEHDDPSLQPLLDEMRRQGFDKQEEPSPLYWANFRVRVMETVEQREAGQISPIVWIWRWVTETPLRMSIIGVSAAAVVAIAIVLNPFGAQAPQLAQNQQPVLNAVQTAPSPAQEIQSIAPHVKAASPVKNNSAVAQTAETNRELADANTVARKAMEIAALSKTLDFEVADAEKELAVAESGAEVHEATATGLPALAASDADIPPSLGGLSQDELESVLNQLQNTK